MHVNDLLHWNFHPRVFLHGRHVPKCKSKPRPRHPKPSPFRNCCRPSNPLKDPLYILAESHLKTQPHPTRTPERLIARGFQKLSRLAQRRSVSYSLCWYHNEDGKFELEMRVWILKQYEKFVSLHINLLVGFDYKFATF